MSTLPLSPRRSRVAAPVAAELELPVQLGVFDSIPAGGGALTARSLPFGTILRPTITAVAVSSLPVYNAAATIPVPASTATPPVVAASGLSTTPDYVDWKNALGMAEQLFYKQALANDVKIRYDNIDRFTTLLNGNNADDIDTGSTDQATAMLAAYLAGKGVDYDLVAPLDSGAKKIIADALAEYNELDEANTAFEAFTQGLFVAP